MLAAGSWSGQDCGVAGAVSELGGVLVGGQLLDEHSAEVVVGLDGEDQLAVGHRERRRLEDFFGLCVCLICPAYS
jgi:hypothetical protein